MSHVEENMEENIEAACLVLTHLWFLAGSLFATPLLQPLFPIAQIPRRNLAKSAAK
jgi:hypothetical protein